MWDRQSDGFDLGFGLTFKFIIGTMSIELARNSILGGFHFVYRISFYGKRWFRFKRKVKRMKHTRMEEQKHDDQKLKPGISRTGQNQDWPEG